MSLSTELQRRVSRDELDLCGSVGSLIRTEDLSPGRFLHAPMAVLPSLIPESVFRNCERDGLLFNELYQRVSSDFSFLEEVLSPINDPFIERQLSMAREVLSSGHPPPCMLSVTRSDYMLGVRPDGSSHYLQVEYNTISCSFAALSDAVSKVHSLVQSKYGSELPSPYDSCRPLLNHSIAEMSRLFNEVYQKYKRVEKSAVIFVIQDPERNIVDQRSLEYALSFKYGIPVFRKTLKEIDDECRLDDGSGRLYLKETEIVLAYYRAGYTPRDYPSESEWNGRLKLELSRCIKCPNLFMHLAGSKKIQQYLAEEGVTERFVGEEKAAILRSYYAGLWNLEDRCRISDCLNRPDHYVLKPQREGGGNNLFGSEMTKSLSALSEEVKSSFILMERIIPLSRQGYFLKGGSLETCESIVSELGFFYALVSEGGPSAATLSTNESLGYLVRSKRSDTDEGGVATGYAVLDSVAFVESA